jgi:hypothetical protein
MGTCRFVAGLQLDRGGEFAIADEMLADRNYWLALLRLRSGIFA